MDKPLGKKYESPSNTLLLEHSMNALNIKILDSEASIPTTLPHITPLPQFPQNNFEIQTQPSVHSDPFPHHFSQGEDSSSLSSTYVICFHLLSRDISETLDRYSFQLGLG